MGIFDGAYRWLVATSAAGPAVRNQAIAGSVALSTVVAFFTWSSFTRDNGAKWRLAKKVNAELAHNLK